MTTETAETTQTTDNIPTLDTLDDLYLAIERGRGTVELVAQCVSDGTIECATVTGLPRRT